MIENISALKKLDEMGYKPKKKTQRKPVTQTAAAKERTISQKQRLQLDLLLEGLSEVDAKELIIYGMYVKKNLTSMLPVAREKRIKKTLECLEKMINKAVKSSDILK